MIDYSKELNAEQVEPVLRGDGPCLVLAGAGSGKTRTITYRVAYLLEQGIPPEEILLVTFTNKAADEMIRRVQYLTGSTSRLPWAGTFHHIAYKILRAYAPLLGYKNNFSVLDSDDSEAIIKLCAKPAQSSLQKNKFPSARFYNPLLVFLATPKPALLIRLILNIRNGKYLQMTLRGLRMNMRLKRKKRRLWILMTC